ncbi:MAG: histidinol-phosphate transaminase [Motiliproteus sp.]
MADLNAAEIQSIIDLSANENPLGPSVAALQAITQSLPYLHRYPARDGDPLRDALAEKFDLSRQQILLGNGATELLEFAARYSLKAEAEQPRDALIATPCFIPYHKVINRAGGHLIKVSCALGEDPLSALLAAVTERTRLIILGNPNNPTGSILSHARLQQFLSKLPPQVLVVLDEAYFEYVEDVDFADSFSLLRQQYNLLILRSLSKAYGLAGLRIGYAVAAPALIEKLNQQRQHYNTNMLAQAAALAALEDAHYLQRTLATNRQGRDYLSRMFTSMGLSFLPSQANFLLLQVGDGERFIRGLESQGIKVKAMDRYDLPAHIRVSIGSPEQNQALVQALSRLLTLPNEQTLETTRLSA